MSAISTIRLRTIDEVIATMGDRFQPEACKKLKATYQWVISCSATNERQFCVRVNEGTFDVVEGQVTNPSVTFQTDEQTYLRLVNGEIKGMTAILTRKLHVRGSIHMASKMDAVFK